MRLASHHSIRRRAAALLAGGPMTTIDLASQLVEDGLDLGDDPQDLVFEALEHDDFDITDFETWVHRPTVLAGQRWWCPVTDGALVLGPAPHVLDAPGGRPYGELRVHAPDRLTTIEGPDGWLAAVRDAAVVTVHDGALRVEPAGAAPEPTPEMVSAVHAVFEAMTAGREHHVVDAGTLVFDAFALAPDAFRTGVVPPAESILTAAGLELHGDDAGEVGTDWVAVERWHARSSLGFAYGLSDEALTAALELLAGLQASLDGEPIDATRLATLVADPDVAETVLREGDRRGVDAPEWLAFTSLLHDAAPTSGGVAYVHAVALEANDMVLDAIDVLAATADVDPHPLALFELALYRADQGDAAGAARLLHQAGVTPDDESAEGDLYREIEPFVARPKAMAGRNDPCPCGSGRKYKACHAGSEQHPLEHRAEWLHHKAMRWAVTHEPELQHALAVAINEAADGDSALLEELWHSTLVSDVVLHEGGAFDDFLAQRGHLLPADEALLAAQWQLTDRSVFEVVDADRHDVQLRDLRSGDVVVVDSLEASDLLQEHRRVIARPVPVGDRWRSFCGLVPLRDRFVAEALMVFDEPSPMAVAELIGRSFAPPQLANSDGETLRFHELTWKVGDTAGVGAALEAAGLHASGPRWTLTDDADSIVATLRLVDDTLTGEANSDRRAAVMLELVTSAVPSAELVDDDVRELWELEADDDDEPPTGEIDFDGPDMQHALEQFTIGYEQRWLDERIPALGGLTPREAAADPIGRRDLERLLAQLPDDPEPGEMSATRLRAQLGM
jgi:hypothetical protein